MSETRTQYTTVAPAPVLLPGEPARNEAQLFEQVRSLLDAFGWLWVHQYDSRRSNAGFPDICAVRGPRLVFIELKGPRGRLAPAQRDWRAALQFVGLPVETYCWWPWNLDTACAVLR